MNDVDPPPRPLRSPAGLPPAVAAFWRDLHRLGLRAVVLDRDGRVEVVLPPRAGGADRRVQVVEALAAYRGVDLVRAAVGRDPCAVLREHVDCAWLACALPLAAAAAVSSAHLGGGRVALRWSRPGNLPMGVQRVEVRGASPGAARALERAGFLRAPGSPAWGLELLPRAAEARG